VTMMKPRSDRDRAMFLLTCPVAERRRLQKQFRMVAPVIGDVPMAFDMVVDRAMSQEEDRRERRPRFPIRISTNIDDQL
jgi:hypothetical protein